MSSLSNPMPHQSPQYLSRDRDLQGMRAREMREHEMRERELREREMRERNHIEMQRAHQEELMMRDREARERERMDRLRSEQQPQQAPVQSHAGSIPIHQPVASKVQNSIHGPNGLLSNGGSGPQQNGPSTSQSSIFGLQPQHEQQRQPPYASQPATQSQQGPQSFLGGPSPMSGQAQLAQGQQPILNVSFFKYRPSNMLTMFPIGRTQLS